MSRADNREIAARVTQRPTSGAEYSSIRVTPETKRSLSMLRIKIAAATERDLTTLAFMENLLALGHRYFDELADISSESDSKS